MRVVLMLSVIALVGCGASHTPSPPSPTETVRIVGTGGANLRMSGNDAAKVATLAFPIDRVWAALPPVFDSLGIPISNLDPKAHVIGHGGFKVHRTLGKIPLTRVLDCGSTQGYPSAESYDIQLSVSTQASAGESGTTSVATMIEAVGRPMAFSGEYVKCSTKGYLETTIADAVRARLSR